MTEVAKEIGSLYPDLVAAGGLAPALQAALAAAGSPLLVSDLDGAVKFVVYARVEAGDRFSQVYIGKHERWFSFDAWARGVMLAAGATPDMGEAARAIDRWVGSSCTTSELVREFPFMAVEDRAAGFEQGTEVEDRWQDYLASMAGRHPELVPVVRAAYARPELRALFAFTSLNRLCFSRCTGYPYSGDLPYIWPQRSGVCVVYGPDEQVLGRGDAEEAVRLVVANLPPGCGPAVAGTARDLVK